MSGGPGVSSDFSLSDPLYSFLCPLPPFLLLPSYLEFYPTFPLSRGTWRSAWVLLTAVDASLTPASLRPLLFAGPGPGPGQRALSTVLRGCGRSLSVQIGAVSSSGHCLHPDLPASCRAFPSRRLWLPRCQVERPSAFLAQGVQGSHVRSDPPSVSLPLPASAGRPPQRGFGQLVTLAGN